MITPIQWTPDNTVCLIDQTRLPAESVWLTCHTYQEVATAIRDMKIRGAPAIGVAAAMGMALGALHSTATDPKVFQQALAHIGQTLAQTRPTAVNLFWAINRMQSVAESFDGDLPALQQRLIQEAQNIRQEDEDMCRQIGIYGAELLPDKANILTHCNAGALATAAYGTALGVIRAAHEQGKQLHVYVDETRPFLQGSRLTAWELMQEGIPMTLLTDNMAGHFIQLGQVDAIVVGADRICANGDVANKIGTYTLSVLAKEHGIPFYVAAPFSTIDLTLSEGSQIPIEERSGVEVTEIQGHSIAPQGVQVANPAFDRTPYHNITAIITEKGVIRPPYLPQLAELGS